MSTGCIAEKKSIAALLITLAAVAVFTCPIHAQQDYEGLNPFGDSDVTDSAAPQPDGFDGGEEAAADQPAPTSRG